MIGLRGERMELILNELSFDGQFSSQDEFIQYVLDSLMPLLDVVIENEIPTVKKVGSISIHDNL